MNYKKLFSKTKALSILLVDDYKCLRDDLQSIFEDIFKEVVVAKDGHSALSIYQNYFDENKKYIDIILTDIEMPKMDGIELSKKILQINKTQEIIVVSAYTDTTHLINLINIGVSQFITKPIDTDTLLNSILNIASAIESQQSNTIEANGNILKLDDKYAWDGDSLMLTKDSKEITLTRHELILMILFAERVNSISTNEIIANHFYDYGLNINEENIRKLVFRFRKKIPKKFVETIYGIGYKFITTL